MMMNELITFVSMVAVLSVMLGMCIGWCFKSILYQPSRKQKLTSYQERQRDSDWIKKLPYHSGIMPKEKPQDTSWGNMSKEQIERLDRVIALGRWEGR